MKSLAFEVFVLLLTCTYATKEAVKKSKKPKPSVPQIDCDIKAGKIINPEFIAKCPAGCQDTKYHVYGTDIYASFSSLCGAAIHSGVVDNSGGKILVRKVAGQSGYKGSYANGIRSLSLPRWRESFIIAEGKHKKGVTYPTTLEYSSSKGSTVKAAETTRVYQKATVVSPVTQPTTLAQETTPISTEPTSSTLKPAPPTAPSITIGKTTTPKLQAVIHRTRNIGLRTTAAYATHRKILRVNTGETDAWKPELGPFQAGFGPKDELNTRSLEPVSQGDPKCKIDLSFLIDGSWSIGKRRFQIQKQFLKTMVQALDVGPAGPLLGIVQYGDDPTTEFNLKTHTNSRDLKAAIEKITQKGGLSNVGRALSFVNKNFFSDANGNRGGAANVAVVMVDGWPTDRVEESSRLARESGINIFFITIEGAAESEKQNVVEPNFVDKAVCRRNGFYSLNVPSWFGLQKVARPLAKRVCDTHRLACSKTCLNSADVGFVIDGSSSVGTGNFRTVLQFVANISKEFEVSDTDTRVGAVQYTYEQRLEFGFDQHRTKSDLLSAIKRVNYWSGGTSTGAAIRYALERLFEKSKPNKRKLMIVITDGRSYDDVRIPALAAHRKGVITYAIGITWAAQDELEVMASDPDKDHAFFVDEFDNLYTFVPQIIQNICTEFNAQPRN
ncbi:vitrin [Ornithorhynchus anatinus]|uniref:vitrin n=1 Tax=Ornithorhynchus anatinus TaxID=9258 RepID=UPI0010A894D2|nr:vitrin [Ornithorhynchus anatinus]